MQHECCCIVPYNSRRSNHYAARVLLDTHCTYKHNFEKKIYIYYSNVSILHDSCENVVLATDMAVQQMPDQVNC